MAFVVYFSRCMRQILVFLGIHIHDACFAAPQHCHRADKQKDAPGNMRRVDRSRYTCRRRSHSPATCHGRRLQRHMVRYAVFYCRFHKKIRRDRSEKMDFHPDSCLYRNACSRIFLQHRAMFYRAFDSRNNTPYSTQRRKNELRTFVEIRHGIVRDYVRRLSNTRQQRNARLYVSKYFPRRHVLRFKVFFSHYARICGGNVCGVYRDRRDKTSHRQTTFKSR